jgi:hypothetical protein
LDRGHPRSDPAKKDLLSTDFPLSRSFLGDAPNPSKSVNVCVLEKMLPQRAICTTCCHPILHIPLTCQSCEREFCFDCYDDNGMPLCVGCVDEQKKYAAHRPKCENCNVWLEHLPLCVCGNVLHKCPRHLTFCGECKRVSCSDCGPYCVECGIKCAVCHYGGRFATMMQCDGVCGRWICAFSTCHFQTWIPKLVCCKWCKSNVPCKRCGDIMMKKLCAYPKCEQFVCSSTRYIVCHAHELQPCLGCSVNKPKLKNLFVLKRECCQECYDRCVAICASLKRLSLVKDMITCILKFVFF